MSGNWKSIMKAENDNLKQHLAQAQAERDHYKNENIAYLSEGYSKWVNANYVTRLEHQAVMDESAKLQAQCAAMREALNQCDKYINDWRLKSVIGEALSTTAGTELLQRLELQEKCISQFVKARDKWIKEIKKQ